MNRNAGRSLIEQTTDGLRDAITCGRWKPGTILPSSRKIEEQLGVSRIVVNAAFARLAEEGYIVPRPRVGTVVRDRSEKLWKGHVVIVVPPGPGNHSDNTAYASLRDALTAEGYLTTPVTVAETRHRHYNDFSLLDTVLRQQTDLVFLLHDQDNIARWLSRQGREFARLSAGDFRPPHCIGVVRRDNCAALAPFAADCSRAGVRSALQMTGFPRADITDALGKTGIQVETLRYQCRTRLEDEEYEMTSWALSALSRRLSAKGRGTLPDLLFFNDDHIATGALLALALAGVRVPEDVRVATWANKNYAPVFTKPLSRMEMDNAAIGAAIARGVLEYLGTGAFPQDVTVGPKYVRGETM